MRFWGWGALLFDKLDFKPQRVEHAQEFTQGWIAGCAELLIECGLCRLCLCNDWAYSLCANNIANCFYQQIAVALFGNHRQIERDAFFILQIVGWIPRFGLSVGWVKCKGLALMLYCYFFAHILILCLYQFPQRLCGFYIVILRAFAIFFSTSSKQENQYFALLGVVNTIASDVMRNSPTPEPSAL